MLLNDSEKYFVSLEIVGDEVLHFKVWYSVSLAVES
jgi:hypothetical protein